MAAPTAIVNGNFEYSVTKNLLSRKKSMYSDFAYISLATKEWYNHYNVTIGQGYQGEGWKGWTKLPSNFSAASFGWQSTQPRVEIPDASGVNANSVEIQLDANGNCYGEIVTYSKGTAIYQDIATTPGAVYRWTLDHASITSSAVDQMYVMIGTTSSQSIQKPVKRTVSNGHDGGKATISNGLIATKVTNTAARSHAGQWSRYTGTYLVPSGQKATRFSFKSANATNKDVGNLIDNVSFSIAYPLKYDLCGGTTTANLDPKASNYAGYHTVNTTITLSSTVPTRTGYTFMGWASSKLADATNKTTYDANKAKLIKSIKMASPSKTVYAVWAKNPTITYVDGFGKTLKTQTVTPGGNGAAPSIPTREGYTFASWNGSDKAVYVNTTVTATWHTNPTVIFIDEITGAQVGSTQKIPYGTDATVPPILKHEHYVFDKLSCATTNITQDTTIYIRYRQTDINFAAQLWDAKYNHAITSKFAPDVSTVSCRLIAEEDISQTTGEVLYHKGDVLAQGNLNNEGRFLHIPIATGKYSVEILSVPKTYLMPIEKYLFEVSFGELDENHTYTVRLPISPQLSRRWGENVLFNGFTFAYPQQKAST